ncbi:hypothetical protein VZT92_002062 [Zoarces viviparus]|uniref:Uncharacterized protein n=1 Tax=Zoarces viviparus TaxID=48416 RepID=A0AAW1G7J9_ZOAVI
MTKGDGDIGRTALVDSPEVGNRDETQQEDREGIPRQDGDRTPLEDSRGSGTPLEDDHEDGTPLEHDPGTRDLDWQREEPGKQDTALPQALMSSAAREEPVSVGSPTERKDP